MALSVTGITTLNTMDSATGINDIGGGGGSNVNTDVFIQGTGSIARKISNSRKGMSYDNGSGIDMTGLIFYVWVNVTTAGKLEPRSLGGLTIRIGTTTANYHEWYVGGSDTYSGGWTRLAIDPSKAASATGGTGLTLTSCQHFGVVFDMNGSASGGDPNCYIDAMHYGAPIVTGTSTDFWADLAAIDQTNNWGMIEQRGAIFLSKTLVTIGGGAVTDVSDTGKVISFEDPQYYDGTALASALTASLLGLVLDRGASATDVEFGTKVGASLDSSVGVSGISLLSEGLRYTLDLDDPDLDSCNWYGCVFSGAGEVGIGGAASQEFVSCIWDNCLTITPGSAQIRQSFILNYDNTDDTVGVDAAIILVVASDLKNTTFSGCFMAFNLSAAGTYTFDNLKFIGNTSDGENTVGVAIVNVINGGDTPTVTDSGSGSTTVNNTVTFTVSGLVVGSEVRIYTAGTQTELDGVETSGATFVYSYNYTSDFNIDLVVHKDDQEHIRIESLPLSNANSGQLIQQRFDRNYNNP